MYKTTLLVLFSIFSLQSRGYVKIEKTLCEYQLNPIGLDKKNPGLSWQMTADRRNVEQVAYRVLVASELSELDQDKGNIWDSGKIMSSQSVQVEFKGKPLKSGKLYYWKVMIWDNYGNASGWSATGDWRMGLLKKTDWKGARWIGYDVMPDSSLIVPAIDNSGDKRWHQGNDVLPLLRKGFHTSKAIRNAVLSITGLGQFEVSMNGQKIGDHFLDPGWTSYDKHALYVTFDVTNRIKQGNNAIAVMLGNGFYYIPGERYHKLKAQFGFPKMICRLAIQYKDRSEEYIISDGSWKATAGPITFSSIYGGEDYDANLEKRGWNDIDFNDNGWRNATVVDGPTELDAQMESPLKIFDSFGVKKITQPKPGVWVYDMGQNASAIPFISLKGQRGATVKLTPSELLDRNGMATQQAIGSPVYFTYTLSGSGIEKWQPRFMYYGFRYLQVEGAVPADSINTTTSLPVVLDIKSLHTRNAAARTGSFVCSNELFNSTFKLIDWAVQSNMVSIFTDCPHREKLGWLEETHLMGNSIQYNYDLSTLFHKVLRDIMHAQTADGLIPDIAPEYVRFDNGFRDSPEWGSSGVILPYDIYKWYNDKTVLQESYVMMKRYTKYLYTKAFNHILSYGLGDWYDIGPKDPGYSQLTPRGITATAMFYQDLKIMTEVAHVLHKYGDEKWFKTEADSVKIAYNNQFFNRSTSQYGTGSQTANAMSIVMGFVSPKYKNRVLNNIIEDIRSHDNGITAGDIGFRYLLKALNDEGRSDVIFDMNSNADVPGYGYQLRKGATALTESWQANANASNDHFMLGHLMEWFYSGLAGISQSASSVGYREIIIRPEVVGNVTYAEASYLSPYGLIKNNWKKKGNRFEMHTSVPVNSTAIIYLPSGKYSVIKEDGKTFNRFNNSTLIGYKKGKTLLKVGSGNYSFIVE
jgi:hypothetical protein